MPRNQQNPGQSERKAEKASKAIKLRMKGLSYRQIAEAIGVSLSVAHGYVSEEMAKIAAECAENAEQVRDMELSRLDDGLVRLMSSDKYKEADPASINALIRLSESRRKLLGLDQPSKVEVEARHTMYEVTIPGVTDEE